MTTAVLANPYERLSSNSYGDRSLNYKLPQTSASAWNAIFPQIPVNKPDTMKPVLHDVDDVTTNTWLNSEVEYAAEKSKGLLVVQLIGSMLIPYHEELAERLLDLCQAAIEEEPESEGISVHSFYNFIKFINTSNLRVRPSISLTSDNNIYASWKKDTGQVFSVYFLPTGDVQFVVFIPNIQDSTKKTRISGITTTENLMKTVESNIKDCFLA